MTTHEARLNYSSQPNCRAGENMRILAAFPVFSDAVDDFTLHIGAGRSTTRTRRRVAVVGGGLAGLAAAIMLAEDGRWNVSVFEQSPVFGGRASEERSTGEHCPRMMLPDYRMTFDFLRRIPGGDNASSVLDSLTRVRRMEWKPGGGWIEIDHINRFRASELSLRDHIAIYRQARRRPIVADSYGPNQNIFGHWRQYSLRSIVRVVRNVWRAHKIFAFPGSTSNFLVAPLVEQLKAHNVELYSSHAVTRLAIGDDAPSDVLSDGHEWFDAAILALFPSDLGRLLGASDIPHSLATSLRHAHCKVLTVGLDRRETVLRDTRPRLYCRHGLIILVQPAESRCVVLCTRVASTDDEYVLGLVRDLLSLDHPVSRTLIRDNQLPAQAVWSATMPKASRVLPVRPPGVHVAGSWLACGYPYDSTESAIRSAWRAVREVNAEFA